MAVEKPAAMLPRDTFATVVRHAPLVSIDLVVRDQDGHVLVGYRNNEPARGTWFVPGGVIRKNERMNAAFRRISSAELGRAYELGMSRLLGVYEHLYEANFAEMEGFGTHYVVIGRELTLDERPAELPKEQHAHYRWLSVEEVLSDPDVHENTKAYFR